MLPQTLGYKLFELLLFQRMYFPIPLGVYLGVELLDHMVILFNLLKACQTVFHSGCTILHSIVNFKHTLFQCFKLWPVLEVVGGGADLTAEGQSCAVWMEPRRQRRNRCRRRVRVPGAHPRAAMRPRYPAQVGWELAGAGIVFGKSWEKNHSFIRPTSSKHQPHWELACKNGKTQPSVCLDFHHIWPASYSSPPRTHTIRGSAGANCIPSTLKKLIYIFFTYFIYLFGCARS